MWKSLIAVILSLCIALGAAGCAQESDSSPEREPPPRETTPSRETDSSTEVKLTPRETMPSREADSLPAGSPSQPHPKSILIKDVPHVQQKKDFCGEACVEMFLRKLGKKMDQDYVFNLSDVDPALARGCVTVELAKVLEKIGFRPARVWYTVAVANAKKGMEAQWLALYGDLSQGIPSIICTRYTDKPDASEHFRLILGYDGKTDEVIYHEPAEAQGAYRRMKKAQFLKAWPLKYDPQQWTVIRIRLEVKRILEKAPLKGITNADYAQHIMKLKKKLAGKKFTIVLQRPFMVAGDEPAQTVKRRSVLTVKWAVDKLKQDYFPKDPEEIIDIWLFKDKESYRKHALEFFGDKPSTPYGYYSAANRALVMNIATGGGTLVHEIVHPFVRANFPKCPAWFNEGLGTLYEQCGEKNGHIYGYTNWRLAGLQKTIRARRVRSFKNLTGLSDYQFYNLDSGTNYAQARYLCYYLQEKGLLVKFYQEFHANQKEDPTGFETLQEVLSEKDMDAFKKKWEAFVLKLTFP